MRLRFIPLAVSLVLAGCNCGPGPGGILIFEDTRITAPVTWSGTVEVRNSFEVAAALTIERCTKVLMPPGGKITIRDNGSIVTRGTADCPVTLQSGKTTPAAGDWVGVEVLSSSSNDTRFTHTHFLHGDGELYGFVWVEGRATVGFDNVTFEAMRSSAVQLEPEARVTAFSGVKMIKTGRYVVRAGGDLVGALEPMTATDTPEARVQVTSSVTRRAAWKNLGVPLELGSMEVTAPLEVAEGSVLKLAPEAVIGVKDGGGLRLLGTASAPIRLESAKSTPAAGDWRRIDLYSSALADNLFRHVSVRHGGDSLYGVLWLETGAAVTLEASTFSQNSSCEVGVDGTVTDLGSTFARCQ